MALTVEQMSSLSAYVMAGRTIEDYVGDAEIPDEDKEEAQRYFLSIQHRFEQMKPGEQMLIPNEWS